MVETSNIVIGWRPSSVSGWGVYCQNLLCQLIQKERNPILYLAPHQMDIHPNELALLKPVLQKQMHLEEILRKVGRLDFEAPVLHALRNDFIPSLEEQAAFGSKNIGVTFFESTAISSEGLNRARSYDLIVTGSTWNKNVLESHGLTNVVNVFQGVDVNTFYPRPRGKKFMDRFTMFSGGKLEYRKSQDVVVSAFKKFHEKHPQTLLVFAWDNQWSRIAHTIENSSYTLGKPGLSAEGVLLIDDWLKVNGLPDDSYVNLGVLPNKSLPDYISNCDMALFPNRCEPGTNLVAMEVMAMGLPAVIAANTGQLDLISENRCYPLLIQDPVKPYPPYDKVDGWKEPDIDEVLRSMEEIFLNRDDAVARGKIAAEFMKKFSWSIQVDHLISEIDALYED